MPVGKYSPRDFATCLPRPHVAHKDGSHMNGEAGTVAGDVLWPSLHDRLIPAATEQVLCTPFPDAIAALEHRAKLRPKAVIHK